MADSATINIQAFQPFEGGNGVLLAVTSTTGSAFVPGTQTDNDSNLRVLVTNTGFYSASIRLGQSGVIATTANMSILPGCAYLLTPPYANPSGVYIAAICATGQTTSLQVTAGIGT